MAFERTGSRRGGVERRLPASAELLDLLVVLALFFDDSRPAEKTAPRPAAASSPAPPPGRGERKP